MSVKLDRMLKQINDAKGNRNESDIPLTDSYWGLKNQYQRELANSGGVHIPVQENLGVSVDSATSVAVKNAAEKHAEGLATTAKLIGEHESARIIAEGEVKAAEARVYKEKNPDAQDTKSDLELELDAKKAKLDAINKQLEVATKSHEDLKNNPPIVDDIIKTEKERVEVAPAPTPVETGFGNQRDHVAGESEQRFKDVNVLDGHGTAPTPTERNPALNSPAENTQSAPWK